jgi:hypothetical protein
MAKAPPDKTPPKPPKKFSPAAKPESAAPARGKSAEAGAGKSPARPLPEARPNGKPAGAVTKQSPAKPAPTSRPPAKPAPAFPKKNQPPAAGAFAARLPLPLGKRFDFARGHLLKQPGVTEDVYFYGPETGWALRYLKGDRPLCSLHIYDEQPVGIVSLGPAANAGIDWRALSPLGQKARKQAHGSPTLLWLDVPLEGTGANDFRAILRAKLAAHEADDEAGDEPAVPPEHDPEGQDEGPETGEDDT